MTDKSPMNEAITIGEHSEFGRDARAFNANPVDISGNTVILGPWYWAKSRTRRIAGVGKFAAVISRPNDLSFYIDGKGYSPESFIEFWLADPTEPCRPSEAFERIAALETACRAALDSGLANHNHWDETMQHGAGCTVCIKQREAARIIREALEAKG